MLYPLIKMTVFVQIMEGIDIYGVFSLIKTITMAIACAVGGGDDVGR